MAAIAKKLGQSALTTSLAALYTCPGGKARAHCSQLFLTNTGATARTIQITAHGTAAANQLFNALGLYAGETKVIDMKVVLASNEVLYLKQDVGTDVTATLYGVEEDT